VRPPSFLLLAAEPGQLEGLSPAGPQARAIAELTRLQLSVLLAVFALTAIALGWAIFSGARRGRTARRESGDAPDRPAVDPPRDAARVLMQRLTVAPSVPGEQRLARTIAGAIALSALLLVTLLLGSYRTGKQLASLGGPDDLAISVIGHQWWWELRYDDPLPSQQLTTANELHIPVGRPVRLQLDSRDVIHSLWVPRLHGKRDLIPGRPSALVIQADEPGEYLGECAEFCGLGHARMQLRVVAQSEADYAAWKKASLTPAAAPSEPSALRGQELFVGTSCALCHTVSGTRASGSIGPDLSHLASRRSLAAGTLPNTRGHLAGWLLDPQRLKPGVRMPSNVFAPDDLNALLAYLEGLK
jgi:cytochrome c oxidase subunit 2